MAVGDTKDVILDINGVRTTQTWTVTSETALTSPTAVHDIGVAKMVAAGMTDENIPGNQTMSGLSTLISTQADNDGYLV